MDATAQALEMPARALNVFGFGEEFPIDLENLVGADHERRRLLA